MARIRSIHPGLFTDEAFASLSMPARVMLLGIWTEADDQGVFEWKPVTLKMRIFSADNLDVVPLLGELARADAVREFSFEGKPHGAVRNFCKYQKPKTPKFRDVSDDEILRYVASKYPKAEKATDEQASFPQNGETGRQREEGGDSSPLGVGNGEGARRAPAKPAIGLVGGSKVSIDFIPADATLAAIRAMGFGDAQYNTEFSRFIPYYMGRGTKADDWNAMLLSWFQRAKPEAAAPSPPSGSMVNKVFVIHDTLGWKSWVAHIFATKGIRWSKTLERKDDAGHVQHGWWWPAEYAPGYDEATGEKLAPTDAENAA